MNEALMVAIPAAEIIIIKRDFDLLRKLIPSLTDDVQMQMVPYTALFCYEAISYLQKHDPSIIIEQESRYSIKDVRQKAKFFELGINKLIRSIDNVDAMQNEYFISLMKYPELGYWNLHTNLGIYYDAQKHIVGNTHYAYYVFQDEKTICQPNGVPRSLKLEEKELTAFGCDMGRIIGSISNAFSETSDFMESDVLPKGQPFLCQDFNTNRCLTDGNEKYKSVRLFLLHVLSSIGFMLYCLKPILIRDTGLLLRLEYITYHYALKRLDEIRNYCKENHDGISDNNLIDMLEGIDCSNANGLRKPSFRNCMMHMGLIENDGTPLISEESFNLSVPFCGLIETQFGLSYSEYKVIIEAELQRIYEKIEKYLGFDLLLKEQ